MGTYLNKGNAGFVKYTTSEYIDKTGMIAYINSTLGGANMLTCVTRPRRFGKSIAANMLCAYYDKSCDSSSLFENFEIANDPTYKEHLNRYPVLYIDITDFTTRLNKTDEIISNLQHKVIDDIKKEYPDIAYPADSDLMDVLLEVASKTGEKFIMIIDEWDAMCRELSSKPQVMDDYVKLLRRLFKGGNSARVFAGAYMTGILPIKNMAHSLH